MDIIEVADRILLVNEDIHHKNCILKTYDNSYETVIIDFDCVNIVSYLRDDLFVLKILDKLEIWDIVKNTLLISLKLNSRFLSFSVNRRFISCTSHSRVFS